MPTNLELQAVIKQHEKKIKDLEAQIGELTQQKDVLESMTKESTGLSGFIVTTPNAGYNGVTRGIQFRNGRGIVLDGPEANHIVSTLRNDFGYKVEHSDNLQGTAYASEAIGKSIVDVLSN